MDAQLPKSQIFEFEGLWGIHSKCGLRILKREQHHIVIVSELYKDNLGTSIAQVSASLAMQICRIYDLDYNKLIYIEHNPAMDSKLSFYDEELYLVHFNISNDNLLYSHSWERLNNEQMDKYLEE